jgi:phosphoribosylanthranilate isomerase
MSPQENLRRTLVKICGVRSPEEAVAILAMGADAVGVVVAEGSPRRVDEPTALAIARQAGRKAVVVDRTPSDPTRLAFLQLWTGPIQIHGDPSDLDRRCILGIPGDFTTLPPHPSACAWLLDAPSSGSGQPWAWSRPEWMDHRPLILAGGLDADHVCQAIASTSPWAVDVSSGVERRRGTKDLALVRAFIQAVRTADADAGRCQAPVPSGFETLA